MDIQDLSKKYGFDGIWNRFDDSRHSSGDNGAMDVLLVEDDDSIASSLTAGLQSFGMVVRRVSRGEDALRAELPDVVLLDVGLPDIDGFEVCRRLRVTSQVPVIMLTARTEEVDRVFGLDIGADDYVTKPFGLRELVARIRAVTRRTGISDGGESSTIDVGPLHIDMRTRRALLHEEEISLTTKEFDLLAHLAAHPGIVHRRTEILETVWDTNWYGPTKTLDAHIAAVRKKLGDNRWIEAVRGVGFRLESPE